MEHDACGVGLVASTEGKKTRKVVEYGIEALKQFGIEEQLMLMEKQAMELVFILKFQLIFLLKKLILLDMHITTRKFALAWYLCQGIILSLRKHVEL